MTDLDKERIEKCVVQIECVNKLDNTDIDLGTGFFVEKNIVITASHVIDKYYENSTDYLIYVKPINANINNSIRVEKVFESERNNFVAILQLEETIEDISFLKFTVGYKIKRGDDYFSFGHPISKRQSGYPIENKVAIPLNENQSKKVNWDLNLSGERLEDFKGFSGSPVIIDDMLIGLVQTESDANGKTISIGMSSIDIMKDFISDDYCEKFDDLLDFKKFISLNPKKIYTIDDMEKELKESTDPSIDIDFFEIDDNDFKENFLKELHKNVYVVGKSREETLYCILNELKFNTKFNKVFIIKDRESWENIRDKIYDAILIPNFYVGELVAIRNNINIFVYGEDEYCTKPNKIELKRRTKRTIIEKLENAGLDNQIAYDYVEKTNGLFIPLKRKLFNGHYTELPSWYSEKSDSFVTALLCGKWTESQGDKNVIEALAGKSYDEFMKELIPFTKGGEPLVIEVFDFGGKRYQIANIEIAWEYLDNRIDKIIWEKFKLLCYHVITKMDPIFDKPFEEHYMALASEEKPENSNVLKLGMIRSLIFRGIYRSPEYQYEIDIIVKDMMSTINSVKQWGYFSQFFTDLSEASPKSTLNRLEDEIKNPSGLRELFDSNSNDFMGRNYYTNVIWSIEHLLLYKKYAVRAVKLLFALDDMNIKYNISNSPRNTLREVFCAWFNISVLSVKEKIALSKYALTKYKNTWDLVFNELPGKHQTISISGSKPKYRNYDDIEQVSNADVHEIYNAYAELCINNINNNIDKWIKMIEQLSIFPDKMLEELLVKLKSELDEMNDSDKGKIKDKLRSEIYRHRFFANSGWAMDQNRLQMIEKICLSIYFEDKAYDYLYLFGYHYDLPILHPIPFNKDSKTSRDENEDLKNKEIEKSFNMFKSDGLDIIHLISLLDKKNYSNLGMYLAKYYTDGKFDDSLYNKMINITGIEQVMLSYVSWIYALGDKSVIEQAKSLSKNYDFKNELYVNILKIENLNYKNHPQIMDEDDSIKQLYWSEQIRRFTLFNDIDTYKWVLSELKKYNNLVSFIECLYDGLEIFEPDELFQYTLDLKSFNIIKRMDQMTDYYINGIIDKIHSCFEGQYDRYYEIMSIEMIFRNILEWDKMKCTQYIFKKDSTFYAQLVDLIYLHEGEEKSNKTTEQSNVHNLFHFYYMALFCPCEYDGSIDFQELKVWVKNFKDKLDQQKQSKLFGHELGRLFAYSPVGKDGYYPYESVREIIEELADESLRNSYITAECNKRGVYSPDAGKTEKEMALRYLENADKIRILYTESAKIYDGLYERYCYDSEAERRRAEDEW